MAETWGDAEIETLRRAFQAKEDDVRRLEAEIKETRAEDAAVRRAYLHEHWRATEACNELRKHDPAKAEELTNKAYRGGAG